ncbi:MULTISPECIES: ThuA domain-containing protein [unclassified Sphingobium]|uniref:ThuA domain-containing protein n=1 Tax=unclassified Sphingobium TaxID=2611147 RepID=UPI0035A6AEC0
MPVIHHHARLNVLVSVRGHPFDRTAFDAMFEAMEGVSATMVDQPAAARLMNPDGMRGFDALLLYDMPGLDFEHPTDRPGIVSPPPELKEGLRALLEQGTGVVALHHALAGWPDWPEYAEWLGGRFLYMPAQVRGRPCPDSGYAHDIAYDAINVAPDHPVMAGIPARLPMRDELYLAEIFADHVTPLLRAAAPFTADRFFSPQHALAGRMHCNDGWDHPPGNDLIGWAKQALSARLVYLQPGDGPAAYDQPDYRRLVRNALFWVARQS